MADIHDAAARGDTEEVRRLLGEGADVNAKTQADWTPLHAAARDGHNDVCELLLEAGAEINARCKGVDKTPRGVAIYREKYKTATFLEEQGGMK